MLINLRRMALAVVLTCSSAAVCASGGITTQTAFPLGGLQLTGPVAPGQPLRISVAMKLRDAAALDQLLDGFTRPGSPSFGSRLRPGEFAARFSPTPAQAQAVADYLASQGFSDIDVAANRLLVSGTASAEQAQAAFGTRLMQFRGIRGTEIANISPIMVPDALAGSVSAVLGLHTVSSLNAPAPRAAVAKENVLTPVATQTAYEVGSLPGAAGVTGAIIMVRDPTGVIADLRMMESTYHLSPVPVAVRLVNNPATQTSGDSEFSMDAQASRGMAGGFSTLYFYGEGGLTQEQLGLPIPAAAINQWAADDLASLASLSMAECELQAKADGLLAATDAALKQAVAQGQTLFVASGDDGGFCGLPGGVNAGVPGVEYPASSPYAVAVGGSALYTNGDGSYAKELAWSGSGGGTSQLEAQPAWQAPIFSATGRSVPDVSMESVPGLSYFLNGGTTSSSGTSLSAPLAMGAWARIQSASGNRFAFAAPLLYSLERAGKQANNYDVAITGFHDQTAIENTFIGEVVDLYPATPGYDQVTGVGTMRVCRVAELLLQGSYCPASPRATTTDSGQAAAGGAVSPSLLVVLLIGAVRGRRRTVPLRR